MFVGSVDNHLTKNRVNHSFSGNIMRHGFVRDTTMEGYTRAKKKDYRNMAKRDDASKRLIEEFRKQSQKVKQLQSIIAASQQQMAYVAMSKYCATTIQSIFRGYIARKELHRRKQLRFLKDWLRFRIYFISRFLASLRIVRASKEYLRKKKNARIRLMNIMIKYANMIRKTFRIYIFKKHILIRHIVRHSNMIPNIILLGTAKAKKYILKDNVTNNTILLNQKIFYHYTRSRRLARLQSLHTAKAFFYSLFSPLIEHNMLSSEKNQSGTTTTTTSTSILRNKKSDLKYSLEIYQYITKACNVRKSRILSIVQESAASTNTTINKRKLNAKKASKKSTTTISEYTKTYPKELQNVFRIRSIYEYVVFLNDLIDCVIKYPEILDLKQLQNEYEIYQKNLEIIRNENIKLLLEKEKQEKLLLEEQKNQELKQKVEENNRKTKLRKKSIMQNKPGDIEDTKLKSRSKTMAVNNNELVISKTDDVKSNESKNVKVDSNIKPKPPSSSKPSSINRSSVINRSKISSLNNKNVVNTGLAQSQMENENDDSSAKVNQSNDDVSLSQSTRISNELDLSMSDNSFTSISNISESQPHVLLQLPRVVESDIQSHITSYQENNEIDVSMSDISFTSKISQSHEPSLSHVPVSMESQYVPKYDLDVYEDDFDEYEEDFEVYEEENTSAKYIEVRPPSNPKPSSNGKSRHVNYKLR